jgi:NAD(P)-dependent dehydrogenase (short-subunit alcohol dehydrogenase family)
MRTDTGAERKKGSGRVALVTGGSRGIGAAIARGLSRMDFAVALTFREREAAALAVVEAICTDGGYAECHRVDARSPAQARAVVDRVAARFGGLDVLVNNAALTRFTPIQEIDVEEFDEIIEVNLRGPFVFMTAAVPHMVRRGHGKIVNVGSTSGLVGPAGMAHYCASKGGLHAMTRAAATELRPLNINVNAVCPGGAETEMLLPELEKQGFVLDAPGLRGPSRRLGRPEDIADAVCFLASDRASWITGVLLPVDGGLTAQ